MPHNKVNVFTDLGDVPSSYTGQGLKLVRVNSGVTALEFVDGGTLYTPIAHKTTEDAINGLVKVNGAGVYSAVTDNSANWNTAFSWGNHVGLYDLAGTAASAIFTHESTYNHGNYNTAYTKRVDTWTQPLAFSGNTASLAGLSGYGTGNYVVGANAGGTGWEYKQLIEGANVTITHGINSVTIASLGGGSLWGQSGTNIYYNSGKVGIGSANPIQLLTIKNTGADAGISFDVNGITGWHLGINDAANDEFQIGSGQIFGSTTWMRIVPATGRLYAQGVYDISGAASANVFVAADGNLYRATSSEKYKKNMREMILEESPFNILKAVPILYEDDSDYAKDHGSKTFIGLSAEELDAQGLKYLVSYDLKGKPNGVMYDRISLYLLEIIKEVIARLKKLGIAAAKHKKRIGGNNEKI